MLAGHVLRHLIFVALRAGLRGGEFDLRDVIGGRVTISVTRVAADFFVEVSAELPVLDDAWCLAPMALDAIVRPRRRCDEKPGQQELHCSSHPVPPLSVVDSQNHFRDHNL